MKDYTLTVEESNLFIKNYKIVNDKIIINLGNGKKTRIDYSIENERNILNKMYRQTINTDIVEEKTKKLFPDCIRKMVAYGMIAMLGAILIEVDFWGMIIGMFTTCLFGGLFLYNAINFIKLEIIKHDIKKTNFYKSNNYLLNEELNRSSALENVSLRTKNIINSNNNKITINSIDKMSLKDLKMIKSNIDRENDYKIEKTKVKKLTK